MKALKKYLIKRKAAIDFLLSKPRVKFNAATYHKLRVEIKKLNALFDIINFCAKGFKRKATFKPFKLIFKQVGKVRELQLEEKMIKKYRTVRSIKGYMGNLRVKRLKEQNIFFKMLLKNISDKLHAKYQEIFSLLNNVDITKVNKYLEKKRSIIENLADESSIQRQQLHELRKLLKTYHYCRKIFILGERNKPAIRNNLLQDSLGKWHDCRAVIRSINKYIVTGGINPKEIGQLDKVKRKIVSKSEVLFRKIKTALISSEFCAEKK